jgi:hypothetical protein
MKTSGTFQTGLRRVRIFLADRSKPILISAAIALTLAGGAALDEVPQESKFLGSVRATDSRLPVRADARPLMQSAGRRSADFGEHIASDQTRQMANWIIDAKDNEGSAFFIVDKIAARLYVFDARARLLGSSAVLLGAAIGDDTVPGIGTRPISQVLPNERTTPAGRFVAEPGRNLQDEDVIWVDYDAAVSMHRVRANNPNERRLQRLASESADDNRISYGCINVPVGFYESYLRPILAMHNVVIYVLPEQKIMSEVFANYSSTSKSFDIGHSNCVTC